MNNNTNNDNKKESVKDLIMKYNKSTIKEKIINNTKHKINEKNEIN